MLEDPFQLPSIPAAEALSRARDESFLSRARAESSLRDRPATGLRATLIDLRKPPAVLASGHRIKGAEVRDPFTFGHQDPLMQANGPLITFCVHGHEVSQFACALLMLHGRNACYVLGGYEALVAAGAALEDISK